jgi:hypothetical protein
MRTKDSTVITVIIMLFETYAHEKAFQARLESETAVSTAYIDITYEAYSALVHRN